MSICAAADRLNMLPPYVEAQLVENDADQGITLWFAKDNTFKLPVTDMIVQLAAPESKSYSIKGVKHICML